MDMAEYMALCLGHPEHGYYMTHDPFGAAGDFTTAPEISQLFGEMIGVWLADLWIKFGSPPSFTLLEIGPGRGTLMADIMRATRRVLGFHAAAKIHLMEMSPVLRNAQSRTLSGYDVEWIESLEGLTSAIPIFIIGNEFLDALPVHQLECIDGKWFERVVSLGADNSLQPGLKEADLSLVETIPRKLRDQNRNGVFEISRQLNQFINSVDNLLIKQGGAALFVDYGHAFSGAGDTLQAVVSHRFTSIFDTPGACDLTAHVDFENIGRIASRDGVFTHGPIEQGLFLKNLGIETRAQALLEGADETRSATIKDGLQRLIDTAQMGSLFKAIALCHDPEIIPAGFHESV